MSTVDELNQTAAVGCPLPYVAVPAVARLIRRLIAVLICLCLGQIATLAHASDYLDKSTLVRTYMERCKSNVELLRGRLQKMGARIKGTDKLAANSDILKCNFVNDKNIELAKNPRFISRTNIFISEHGVAKYVASAKAGIDKSLRKFKYKELLERAEKSGASIEDLTILSILAKSMAFAEACISTVESFAGRGSG